MSRFIPVDPEKWAAMVKAQSDLVRYKEMCDELDAECTRLKAEVERLTDKVGLMNQLWDKYLTPEIRKAMVKAAKGVQS